MNDKQLVVERLIGISEDIKEKFIELLGSLSPENLTCDGELPKAQVDRAYKAYMKEWFGLEKELGRTVSEDEVSKWWMKEDKVI